MLAMGVLTGWLRKRKEGSATRERGRGIRR